MRRLWIGLGALVALALVVLAGGWVALRRGDIPYAVLERTHANAQSRWVELPTGVRMHFRDQGARDGATLLLLHGYSASLHAWEPWVARLGGRLRLVTIDLPGHGLTRAPAGYRASIEQYVADVDAFAQAQQLARFTIVGSSMGGNVAWEYALAHPERVEALVLVGAFSAPSSATSTARASFARVSKRHSSITSSSTTPWFGATPSSPARRGIATSCWTWGTAARDGGRPTRVSRRSACRP